MIKIVVVGVNITISLFIKSSPKKEDIFTDGYGDTFRKLWESLIKIKKWNGSEVENDDGLWF